VFGVSLAATKQRLRRARMMLVSALARGGERYVPGQQELLGCWQARRLVSSYLDGELDDLASANLEAHLERCATCPPLYRALVGATSSLGGLRDLEDSAIPSEVADRIGARLARE